MKSIMVRVPVLVTVLFLAACSSAPPPKPQTAYPEPVFSAERVVPEGSVPASAVYDPWQGMNKRIYNFNYHFDRWVFLPVVRGYNAVLPSPVRTGVFNFFGNFRDVRTMANSLLQASPTKLAQSTGRVLVNTTLGLLGVFDVATSMGMPKPVEDFGQTLGRWGVGKGPYLVVPFLGPSNLRDGIGLIPDFLLLGYLREETLAKPARTVAPVVDGISTRANVSFRYYETGSAFEYNTVRWLYSTKRELDVEK